MVFVNLEVILCIPGESKDIVYRDILEVTVANIPNNSFCIYITLAPQ